MKNYQDTTVPRDLINLLDRAVERTVQASGARYYVRERGFGAGTFAIYGSRVAVRRCLAALGFSFAAMAEGALSQDLTDVDGERRGSIVYGDDGASADIHYAAQRLPACLRLQVA